MVETRAPVDGEAADREAVMLIVGVGRPRRGDGAGVAERDQPAGEATDVNLGAAAGVREVAVGNVEDDGGRLRWGQRASRPEAARWISAFAGMSGAQGRVSGT